MVLEAHHREKIKSFVASSPDPFRVNNDDNNNHNKNPNDMNHSNVNHKSVSSTSTASSSSSVLLEDSEGAKVALKGLEELKLRRECEILQERVLSCPLEILAGNDEIVNILLLRFKQQLESSNIRQSINEWNQQEEQDTATSHCITSNDDPQSDLQMGLMNNNKMRGNGWKNDGSRMVMNNNSNKMVLWHNYHCWMVNLLWIVLLGSYVVCYCLLDIHDVYVSPMIQAAKWREIEEDRLSQELTYYERQCDASDLTANNLQELLLSTPSSITSNNKKNNEIAEAMMRHGMTVMPSPVMRDETMDDLREFILQRNAELTRDEAIPLDGGHNRWSFGIGANEDPSVVQALKEVSTNELLTEALQELLGDANPAVVEITAITAAYGAPFQGFHADVKPLASAVKYARTFTHSYSLFVPLQDTTPAMGATELCPGTHYCTNDLTDVCEQHAFQAASSSHTWNKGHALLLNQCAWHRGYEHSDPNAPQRVVFILTFISRPKPNSGDYRQLSHGTYFHIRWDMYGHTLFDLRNPKFNMNTPFSILRSLGLYKPNQSMWGWDWLSTTCLRIANFENGYQFDDLYDFVYRQNAFHIPFFLQGDITPHNDNSINKNEWEIFIQQTLQRITDFTKYLNIAILSVYLLATIIIAIPDKKLTSQLSYASLRVLFCAAIVTITAYYHMAQLHQSQWAKSIRTKTLYARPFPTNSHQLQTHTSTSLISNPHKHNVLIGTRFHSRYIGMYNQFLNYHPGNYQWLTFINDNHDLLYLPHNNNNNNEQQDENNVVNLTTSTVFQTYLLDQMMHNSHEEEEQPSLSFLKQDIVTGLWYPMTAEESLDHTMHMLTLIDNPFLSIMDQEISYLQAEAQFQFPCRNSGPLRRNTLQYLSYWRKIFLLDPIIMTTIKTTTTAAITSNTSKFCRKPPLLTQRLIETNHDPSSSFLYSVGTKSNIKADVSLSTTHTTISPLLKHYIPTHDYDDDMQLIIPFEKDDVVEVNHNGDGFWYSAIIINVLENDHFEVKYDLDGLTEIVSANWIREHPGPFQMGEIVNVESLENKLIYDLATILQINQNGISIDVLYFDDNTMEHDVNISRLARVQ